MSFPELSLVWQIHISGLRMIWRSYYPRELIVRAAQLRPLQTPGLGKNHPKLKLVLIFHSSKPHQRINTHIQYVQSAVFKKICYQTRSIFYWWKTNLTEFKQIYTLHQETFWSRIYLLSYWNWISKSD